MIYALALVAFGMLAWMASQPKGTERRKVHTPPVPGIGIFL